MRENCTLGGEAGGGEETGGRKGRVAEKGFTFVLEGKNEEGGGGGGGVDETAMMEVFCEIVSETGPTFSSDDRGGGGGGGGGGGVESGIEGDWDGLNNCSADDDDDDDGAVE